MVSYFIWIPTSLDILGDFQINLSNLYSVTTDNGSIYLKVTSLFSEEETDDDNNYFESGVDSFNASVLNDTNDDHTFQITSLRCAAHTLQLCVKDAIKTNRKPSP